MEKEKAAGFAERKDEGALQSLMVRCQAKF